MEKNNETTIINDTFWNKYKDLLKEVIVPYQYKALNDQIVDAEPSYSIRNFRIAAGDIEGEYMGAVFQDSDVAKWLEAVGYVLKREDNEKLRKQANEIIDIISRAQLDNGYLHTYHIIKEPDEKWSNLYDTHELYCAGHMIEAGVSYYEATKNKKIIEVVTKLANHIYDVFGLEESKLSGYPGHPEIELSLVKLYKLTNEEKYLKLSEFFINERGNKPNFFLKEWNNRGKCLHESSVFSEPNLYYNQSHLPVRDQDKAVGHAVRAVYLYAGMSDIALLLEDKKLKEACEKIWDNIVNKQMYITGGIGATEVGEAFTSDYDLPNDTMYCETCASVGLTFYANRMFKLSQNSEYADIIENALYNTILASTATDGMHYFYVNPLEINPYIDQNNPIKNHVKFERQKWFGVSCCPPNVARLIGNLDSYLYYYLEKENTLFINQYIGNDYKLKTKTNEINISQISEFPYSGIVKLNINQNNTNTKYALRVPSWSRVKSIKFENKDLYYEIKNGYIIIENLPLYSEIDIVFDMDIQLMTSNENIKYNSGKIALKRGPLVYCLEEYDNNKNLSSLSISTDEKINFESMYFDTIGEAVILNGKARKEIKNEKELYSELEKEYETVTFKAIPYMLWGNRGVGEMQVWTRYN